VLSDILDPANPSQGIAMKYKLAAALLAASLVACQANPVSGRKQLIPVSRNGANPSAQARKNAGRSAEGPSS
jgi:hypothetical protein